MILWHGQIELKPQFSYAVFSNTHFLLCFKKCFQLILSSQKVSKLIGNWVPVFHLQCLRAVGKPGLLTGLFRRPWVSTERPLPLPKDCFPFRPQTGFLAFWFTLMMRNHKSFLSNLCYKFLLFPQLFGTMKIPFFMVLGDVHRATSTQWSWCKAKDSIKIVFFLCVHAHWGLIALRQEWWAFWKGYCCFDFLFISSFGIILLYKKWNDSSTIVKETKSKCLSVRLNVSHNVRINICTSVRGLLNFQWCLFNKPHIRRH